MCRLCHCILNNSHCSCRNLSVLVQWTFCTPAEHITTTDIVHFLSNSYMLYVVQIQPCSIGSKYLFIIYFYFSTFWFFSVLPERVLTVGLCFIRPQTYQRSFCRPWCLLSLFWTNCPSTCITAHMCRTRYMINGHFTKAILYSLMILD